MSHKRYRRHGLRFLVGDLVPAVANRSRLLRLAGALDAGKRVPWNSVVHRHLIPCWTLLVKLFAPLYINPADVSIIGDKVKIKRTDLAAPIPVDVLELGFSRFQAAREALPPGAPVSVVPVEAVSGPLPTPAPAPSLCPPDPPPRAAAITPPIPVSAAAPALVPAAAAAPPPTSARAPPPPLRLPPALPPAHFPDVLSSLFSTVVPSASTAATHSTAHGFEHLDDDFSPLDTFCDVERVFTPDFDDFLNHLSLSDFPSAVTQPLVPLPVRGAPVPQSALIEFCPHDDCCHDLLWSNAIAPVSLPLSPEELLNTPINKLKSVVQHAISLGGGFALAEKDWNFSSYFTSNGQEEFAVLFPLSLYNKSIKELSTLEEPMRPKIYIHVEPRHVLKRSRTPNGPLVPSSDASMASAGAGAGAGAGVGSSGDSSTLSAPGGGEHMSYADDEGTPERPLKRHSTRQASTASSYTGGAVAPSPRAKLEEKEEEEEEEDSDDPMFLPRPLSRSPTVRMNATVHAQQHRTIAASNPQLRRLMNRGIDVTALHSPLAASELAVTPVHTYGLSSSELLLDEWGPTGGADIVDLDEFFMPVDEEGPAQAVAPALPGADVDVAVDVDVDGLADGGAGGAGGAGGEAHVDDNLQQVVGPLEGGVAEDERIRQAQLGDGGNEGGEADVARGPHGQPPAHAAVVNAEPPALVFGNADLVRLAPAPAPAVALDRDVGGPRPLQAVGVAAAQAVEGGGRGAAGVDQVVANGRDHALIAGAAEAAGAAAAAHDDTGAAADMLVDVALGPVPAASEAVVDAGLGADFAGVAQQAMEVVDDHVGVAAVGVADGHAAAQAAGAAGVADDGHAAAQAAGAAVAVGVADGHAAAQAAGAVGGGDDDIAGGGVADDHAAAAEAAVVGVAAGPADADVDVVVDARANGGAVDGHEALADQAAAPAAAVDGDGDNAGANIDHVLVVSAADSERVSEATASTPSSNDSQDDVVVADGVRCTPLSTSMTKPMTTSTASLPLVAHSVSCSKASSPFAALAASPAGDEPAPTPTPTTSLPSEPSKPSSSKPSSSSPSSSLPPSLAAWATAYLKLREERVRKRWQHMRDRAMTVSQPMLVFSQAKNDPLCLEQEIGALQQVGMVTVTNPAIRSLSLACFEEMVQSRRPSGIHLALHSSAPNTFVFEGAQGHQDLVTTETLIRVLAPYGAARSSGFIEYILVNGCDSAGALPRLCQECGIPFAIGWESAVSSPACVIMAVVFYQSLYEGVDYVRAFRKAKVLSQQHIAQVAAAAAARSSVPTAAGRALPVPVMFQHTRYRGVFQAVPQLALFAPVEALPRLYALCRASTTTTTPRHAEPEETDIPSFSPASSSSSPLASPSDAFATLTIATKLPWSATPLSPSTASSPQSPSKDGVAVMVGSPTSPVVQPELEFAKWQERFTSVGVRDDVGPFRGGSRADSETATIINAPFSSSSTSTSTFSSPLFLDEEDDDDYLSPFSLLLTMLLTATMAVFRGCLGSTWRVGMGALLMGVVLLFGGVLSQAQVRLIVSHLHVDDGGGGGGVGGKENVQVGKAHSDRASDAPPLPPPPPPPPPRPSAFYSAGAGALPTAKPLLIV